jgi:hypothetical protein
MVDPKNNTPNKKEHFNVIDDIMGDSVKLAIAIAIILLIVVAVYLFIHHHKTQAGSGLMEMLSDVSPMAPLTNTPSM